MAVITCSSAAMLPPPPDGPPDAALASNPTHGAGSLLEQSAAPPASSSSSAAAASSACSPARLTSCGLCLAPPGTSNQHISLGAVYELVCYYKLELWVTWARTGGAADRAGPPMASALTGSLRLPSPTAARAAARPWLAPQSR